MELVSAKIKNFRSIEEINIDIENDTKILVGLSESGKSNLLKALSVLSEDVEFQDNYLRDSITSGSDSYVKFSIKLSDGDIVMFKDELNTKHPYIDIDKVLYKPNGRKRGLEFLLTRKYFYKVDFFNKKRNYFYQVINNEEYIIKDNIINLKASEDNPAIIKNIGNSDEEIVIKENSYVDLKEFEIISNSETEILSVEEFNKYISDEVITFIKKDLIKVIFWQYNDKNLLPAKINAEEFVNDPNLCIPLKNIFHLCGYEDIIKEYNLKKRMGSSAIKNFLVEISEKITEYLKRKWESMPETTSILISPDGTDFSISINDETRGYDMMERSDGYKRFITFLLMISLEHETSQLKNNLILIDCPEAEIDIPGQKHLRNELISIGKNNYVFYATHSTHMVDNSKIYRHYRVIKDNEITTISMCEEADYSDETIIFTTLGADAFQNIKENNLVFEGWTDKTLFKVGKSLISSPKKTKKINQLGLSHLPGVKSYGGFCTLWGLIGATNKYIIISDCDTTSLNKQNEFNESNYIESGQWLTYKDLINLEGKKFQEAEDFLKSEYIKGVCDQYLEEHNPNLQKISIDNLNNAQKANMNVIKEWLEQFEYDNHQFSEAKNKIKDKMFSNLQKTNIVPEYSQLLENLYQKIFL